MYCTGNFGSFGSYGGLSRVWGFGDEGKTESGGSAVMPPGQMKFMAPKLALPAPAPAPALEPTPAPTPAPAPQPAPQPAPEPKPSSSAPQPTQPNREGIYAPAKEDQYRKQPVYWMPGMYPNSYAMPPGQPTRSARNARSMPSAIKMKMSLLPEMKRASGITPQRARLGKIATVLGIGLLLF